MAARRAAQCDGPLAPAVRCPGSCANQCRLTCLARLPKTKSMASITFDFPLPLGPTTAEKDCGRYTGGIWSFNTPHKQLQQASSPCLPVKRSGTAQGRRLTATTMHLQPCLVEWTDTLLASIRLEVFQYHLTNHQAPALLRPLGRGARRHLARLSHLSL